jgi:tetratricopeptide (TPR) repeat protein
MQNWLPVTLFADLQELLDKQEKSNAPDSAHEAILSYLGEHPVLLRSFTLLLERGGPQGRDLVLGMAEFVDSPDLQAIVRDYALSQHGPDQVRIRALNIATQKRTIRSGPQRMWLRGEWTDVIAMGFEIGDEGETDYPIRNKKALHWMQDAIYAQHDFEMDRAQELLEKALELEPNHPGIMNNLAQVYASQDRITEAETLLKQIQEAYPDYFFGQINRANQLISQGNYDAAHDILGVLLQRDRLHFSEFNALCEAHINLSLARNEIEAAETWLEMWSSVEDPSSPRLQQWQQRIQGRKGLGALRRWLPGR